MCPSAHYAAAWAYRTLGIERFHKRKTPTVAERVLPRKRERRR